LANLNHPKSARCGDSLRRFEGERRRIGLESGGAFFPANKLRNKIVNGNASMLKLLKRRFVPAILFFAVANFCFAQQIFNVKDYGAIGDGATLDSPAVNSAIAAAGAAGGGTVVFPSGTYLCGSIHLTNNLTLYLSNNAVVWASSNNIDVHESSPYSSYQDQGHSYFHDALIWGIGLTNLAFAGPGKIDGHKNLTTGNPGSTTNTTPGDKALCLVMCSNISITDITITNGGHFGILAQACTNMYLNNVKIWEKTSRDGFNLIDSSDVLITNCDLQGSDDTMCLKSTYALGRKGSSRNITVANCTILSTENNATQFGSETVGNFTNVTFSNLTITGAGKAGIGITSQDGAVISGVTYNNITMSNCACPIFIKLDYRTTDTPNPAVGAISNIYIANVTAVHSTLFNRTNTSTINGFFNTTLLTNVAIQNIGFSNVNVSNIGGHPAGDISIYPPENQDWQPQNFGQWPSYGWYLRWARNIGFTNCQVHFDNNDDRPAVMADTVSNIFFDGFIADIGNGNTNYDMGFTNVSNIFITNAIASATAPSPGAALRISIGTNVVGSLPPTVVTNFIYEAENLSYTTNGAVAVLQNDSNSSGGHWLALEATGPGQWIEFTTPEIPAGTYDVQMSYKSHPDRGILSFTLDGVTWPYTLDQYTNTPSYPTQDWGTVTFTNAGTHTIRLTCVGENPSATGYWLSSDRFFFLLVQPPSPVLSNAVTFSDGVPQFSGSGFPTLNYRVLVSTNLNSTNWMILGTIYADANGNLIFSDTNSASTSTRFYRLATP
jgi:hypothetical protein